jgi:hypothetical protein
VYQAFSTWLPTLQDSKRQRITDWHLQLPTQVQAQSSYGNILYVLTLKPPNDLSWRFAPKAMGNRMRAKTLSSTPWCCKFPIVQHPFESEADQALREFAGEYCPAPQGSSGVDWF